LLATGLCVPEAQKWAPWAGALVDALITEVDAQPPSYWTGQQLGNMVKLTNAERERLQLWSLRPWDVDWHVVQTRVRERRRARWRKRARDHRKAVRMTKTLAKDLDERSESLFVLMDTRWTSVAKLAIAVAGGRAWCRPDGKSLAGESLRVTVRRALDELSARNLIESKTERDRHGFPMRRVRRMDLKMRHFGPRTPKQP
jgi:hypothetical protein